MRKGSIWRIVALLMALAMVAAACGGDGDDTTTTTTGPGATTTTGADVTTTTAAVPVVCEATIGLMLPITGPAPFIGEVQLNWAKYAVDVFNTDMGSTFEVLEGDTKLDPAEGALLAPQLLDNSDIVAIVGPASSPVVDAAGAILDPAGITFISPSSTQVGLAAKYAGLFRTVPTDADQGPTTAAFMIAQGAQKVFILDDQTSYSTGLADSTKTALEAGGVEVVSESVTQDITDFSALVATIPDDADFVYLPWQVAANGEILGNQMAEQGKNIVIFGSDGMDSEDFTIAGSFVAAFAPDIAGIPGSADLLAGYLDRFDSTNTFGPPVFVAVKVILEAVDRVCQAGETPDRANVLAEVGNTDQADSILGSPIKFTPDGDLDGGQFYVFQNVGDGTKTLVP